MCGDATSRRGSGFGRGATVTDDELEAMTAPDWYGIEKPLPGKSLTLSQVDAESKVHRCGVCNNSTGVFNPACPNRRSDV